MAYRHRWLIIYCIAWAILLGVGALKKSESFSVDAIFAVFTATLWFLGDEVGYRIWGKKQGELR